MKIFEIEKSKGNVDPNDVLHNIANMVLGAPCSTSYCYGQVAKSISSGSVDDSDLIILLGSGNYSAHGIISDRQGTPKVDSFSAGFKGIKDEKYVYEHPDAPGKLKLYKPVKVISVGNFKNKYLS